ncbi:SAF domain-containing protein [Kutzneria buriramensis]|uniref:Flp pilus assembly protein CpaB n=1 Tax=Kutzneria buriramensis TaxID=1045776 RepID=A0A3E0HBE7_9PSEU|nr:SAF domain-containing protein [Kutzneria buriramensis]REH41755.1 Flp pilus assembly protein CpaB [Kutzneria buriramensis]
MGTTRLRRLLTLSGWARTILLRRTAAALLAVLAVVLAAASLLHDREHAASVLVAARDVPAGTTLTGDDVRIRALPAAYAPAGSLHDAGAAVGRVLAGSARAGEPITDVRLVGRENTLLAGGDPNAEAVPVRLTDAAVADLLRAGSHVDVVGDPAVLANDAIVITVRPSEGMSAKGRLVVVALPRQAAAKVAAASLTQPVTVTLR